MQEVNLIIAAMDEEVIALVENLGEYEIVEIDNYKTYKFNVNDEIYYLIQGQIGKVNTAIVLSRLALLLNIKRVFNIGTSGGIDKSLNINDVIVATKVGYHDVDVTNFGYKVGQIPGEERYYHCDIEFIDKKLSSSKYSIRKGIILSGDSFITRENINSTNLINEECLCCEMESATVGQVCTKLNIPFVIIRSISDLTFKQFDFDSNDTNVHSSSTNSALVLLELLK